ncbi:NAD(P)-dependent dehydrogenase (short-subunit alcohol dehydrogenase family) [Microbacterium halimionae]|uniref:NAD(P)-dependent dehydrogenase (Short-subunit alcohol dehydrogenase family) n=1 Tax=Microbacterium halimionae TaxID=1526413 RepID=A0A7W3JNY3_9MICO|nr:3-hydroxyacyl-CoA dehydrogenase [Microbacterium halimionae]MBA8816355.1 NAD(P)-dependent dehydrogenase (short-subunit alcohol dehydrogenase family) [Microbacterium halimionae]NII96557.1 NAD(P)-dependent dehydrogenase (short-subunit alcohol dehydrogenase family) [Microbacterium halimionae]
MDTIDQVALVTGGASGLGLATTLRLVAHGALVVVLDLPSSDGADVARAHPGHVHFAAGDIRDPASVMSALDLAGTIGDLRALINCAGVAPAAKVVSSRGPHPLDEFQRAIDINLVGTFNVIRLAVERMQQLSVRADGERGVVINTASVAAFDGQIGQAAYSASKSAIVGMTLPIARELAASQIRVVTIAPGIFDTPLLASLPEAARTSLAGQVPHPQRLGAPSEFALMVTQIIENPMLNGETIRLDGAIRMAPR